ncbi:MAG: YraN family protein [Tepidiformaceae bacterium]
MTARKALGDFGERVAAHRLEAEGLRILARNVRTPAGEIDLVAEDGTDLAFVEVRTRRELRGAAAESLTPAKLQRMWRCAMEYCERHELLIDRARIDLLSIDLGPNGEAARVEHFRGLEIPD